MSVHLIRFLLTILAFFILLDRLYSRPKIRIARARRIEEIAGDARNVIPLCRKIIDCLLTG